MPACAVSKCTNYFRKTKGSDVHYHRFPKDKKVIKQWLVKCKRKDVNVNNATVCNRHFTEDDYVRDLKAELLGLPPAIRLKPTAVPSLFLDGSKNLEDSIENVDGGCSETTAAAAVNNQKITKKKARSDRCAARDIRKRALLRLASLTIEKTRDEETQTEPITMLTDKEMAEHKKEISRQKFVSCRLIKEVLKLKAKNAQLTAEKIKWKQEFKLKVQQQVKQMVGKVFTENQMKYLQKGSKRMVWDEVDIGRALALRAMSRKCYDYLRKEHNMPLPGLSTLKRWIAHMSRTGKSTLPPSSAERTDVGKADVLPPICLIYSDGDDDDVVDDADAFITRTNAIITTAAATTTTETSEKGNCLNVTSDF